ncbi:hypothetical protein H4R34_004793 [Dimargaris verticillata]|uniref:G-protein coupled receptors family 3 profile domain-containing protein n=1 Tax=Dimargaris verticillata TaxID=2761393 RepID=A0A9W8AY51_9FUNG|nr:hypothetical protein H4R34_004793 [Dimargaris verticillata]
MVSKRYTWSLWLIALLLLVCLDISHARLYLTNVTTGEKAVYRSIDYEGDISDPYVITGVLVAIPLDADCCIHAPAMAWNETLHAPTNGTHISPVDSTVLILTRWQADGRECPTYATAMRDITDTIETLEIDLDYPPVSLLLFTAKGDSLENFGSANDEFYASYASDKPDYVNVAYVARDIGTLLHAQTLGAARLPLARVVQDMGVWNRFRESSTGVVMSVLLYVFVVPVLAFAVYYMARLVYIKRSLRDRRIIILIAAVLFLVGGLIVPMGYSQRPHEIFIRYVCWFFGYVAYTWVLVSWARIIRKTQKPRFWWMFTFLVYLGLLMMTAHCVSNCVYAVYVTNTTASAKSIIGTMVLPPVLALKAFFMAIYGTLFLRYIRRWVGVDNLRKAFRKLTYLTFTTFVAFIIFAVCATMTNSYFNSIVWVVPFRSICCSLMTAILAATTLAILHVHEKQPLAANPRSSPSTDVGTNLSGTMVATASFSQPKKVAQKRTLSPPALHPASSLGNTKGCEPLNQTQCLIPETPGPVSTSVGEETLTLEHSLITSASLPAMSGSPQITASTQLNDNPVSLRPHAPTAGRFTLTRPTTP